MKIAIFLGVFFGYYANVLSQTYNLVPNSGFEKGMYDPANFCYSNPTYCGSGYSRPKFGDHIDYWEKAFLHPSTQGEENCTPDWMNTLSSFGLGAISEIPAVNFSPRFVRIANKEGIRVGLIQKLRTGKTYRIRLKIAPSGGGSINLRVHLAKFGEHWNAEGPLSSNIKRSDVANFTTLNQSPFAWQAVEAVFSVDVDNELENLIFMAETSRAIFIDDVELFEKTGQCPESILIQNHTYNYPELPIEASVRIKAGNNVGAPIPFGDVIVAKTANVTYKAGVEIFLQAGFHAQYGTNFHAYIAPCGIANCSPTPIADAGGGNEGIYPTLCGPSNVSRCFQIGGAFAQGNYKYNWTSIPSSAVQYLSSTTIPNPTFCFPGNFTANGSITYNLTVSNECGRSSSDRAIIYYSTGTPQDGISVIQSIVDGAQADPPLYQIGFTLNLSTTTEKIRIEIWNDTYTQRLQEFFLVRGIDFTDETYLVWTHPDPLSLVCPGRKYYIKIFSKSLCFTQYHEGNSGNFLRGAQATSCDRLHDPGYTAGNNLIDPLLSNSMQPNPLAAKIAIDVSPNPNNGSFTIRSIGEDKKEISVIDLLGKIVYKNSGTTDTMLKLNLENQPKGIYLIKVSNAHGDTEIKKIILQ